MNRPWVRRLIAGLFAFLAGGFLYLVSAESRQTYPYLGSWATADNEYELILRDDGSRRSHVFRTRAGESEGGWWPNTNGDGMFISIDGGGAYSALLRDDGVLAVREPHRPGWGILEMRRVAP